MAVKGAIRIETRLTIGDEYGIYRITELKQGYLMLAFEKPDEARAAAKGMAKLLGIPHKDHIYTETKLTGAVSGRVSCDAPNKSNTGKQSAGRIQRQSSAMIDVSVPTGAVRPKPKKVMGARKVARTMFESEASETEVEEAIKEMYSDAGHTSESAKKNAQWITIAVAEEIRNGKK